MEPGTFAFNNLFRNPPFYCLGHKSLGKFFSYAGPEFLLYFSHLQPEQNDEYTVWA